MVCQHIKFFKKHVFIDFSESTLNKKLSMCSRSYLHGGLLLLLRIGKAKMSRNKGQMEDTIGF